MIEVAELAFDGAVVDGQDLDLVVDHAFRQYAPAQADGDHHLEGLEVVGGHRDFHREAVTREGVDDDATREGQVARQHGVVL